MKVKLTSYYIDKMPFSLSKAESNKLSKLDENSVIMSRIPYTTEYNYHVTAIASYAIHNEERSEVFNSQIKWLMENIDKDGAYRHKFKFSYYSNFPREWIGGLCQGLAISALTRAYKQHNKKIYLATAKKAYDCLTRDINDDGCVYTDENDNIWIEEYPVQPYLHILNGYIYALFGVHDLYNITKQKDIKKFWDKCIKTISINLKSYDLGYWSLYDLVDKFPATEFYHNVHIKQLQVLHKLTQDKQIGIYYNHWKATKNKQSSVSKAKRERMLLILKKRGPVDLIKRYFQRRRWLYG